MNIFTIFCYQLLAKYSPKRTQLHHFKKNSWGSIPPDPPNKRFAPCKYPHFYKNILNPPQNEILDTPLHTCIFIMVIST